MKLEKKSSKATFPVETAARKFDYVLCILHFRCTYISLCLKVEAAIFTQETTKVHVL